MVFVLDFEETLVNCEVNRGRYFQSIFSKLINSEISCFLWIKEIQLSFP